MVKVTSRSDRAFMLPYTSVGGDIAYLFLDYLGHEVQLDDCYYDQLLNSDFSKKIKVEVVT